jgi:hypothetical protein
MPAVTLRGEDWYQRGIKPPQSHFACWFPPRSPHQVSELPPVATASAQLLPTLRAMTCLTHLAYRFSPGTMMRSGPSLALAAGEHRPRR